MDVDGPESGTQTVFQANDYGVEVDFDELDEDEQEVSACSSGCSNAQQADMPVHRMARRRWKNVSSIASTAFRAKSTRCRSTSRPSSGESRFNSIADLYEKLTIALRCRLGDSEARFKEIDEEFDQAREETRKAKDAFNAVKKKRCDLFNKAFKHIEDRIDEVYKDLTKGTASPQGGVAYLSLEEPEVSHDVTLDYRRYWLIEIVCARNPTCTVSSTTRCRRSSVSATWISCLEEKRRWPHWRCFSPFTRAFPGSFLLCRLHESIRPCELTRVTSPRCRFQPSPFFVLDEVDGALGEYWVHPISKLFGKGL